MSEARETEAPSPSPLVFGAWRRRSCALWSSASVIAFWFGLFGLSTLRDQHIAASLLDQWHLMLVSLPVVAWLLDRVIAAKRGDPRPLHRPILTVVLSYIGSAFGMVAALLLALSISQNNGFAIVGGLLSGVAAGAWTGARLGAWGAARHAVVVGYDATTLCAGALSWRLAHRDVARVDTHETRVVLERADGSTRAIETWGAAIDHDALLRALREAVNAAKEEVPVGLALRRAGRDLATWRDDLASRTHGGQGFRERAIERNDLEVALTHPAALAEERIGAALALRSLDADGATRVRVAADGAQSPPLRDALSAIAQGRERDDLLSAAVEGPARRARAAKP